MHPDTPARPEGLLAASIAPARATSRLATCCHRHVRQPHARRPPPDRRLGWLHQPSFKAGQSDMRGAGLVEPTQPTVMPRNQRFRKKGSRLPPLLQGRAAVASKSEEHTSELQSLM